MNHRLLSRFLSITLLALPLLLASCHSRTKVVRVEDNRDPRRPKEETFIIDMNTAQGRIVNEAGTWLGTPYKYGESTKGKGTDCSGMVMQVYLSAANIKLPRTAATQSDFCTPVKDGHPNTADLVFFATGSDSTRVTHVGIVIDKDRFIHASSSKGVVISRFSSPYYTKRLLGYGRVPNL